MKKRLWVNGLLISLPPSLSLVLLMIRMREKNSLRREIEMKGPKGCYRMVPFSPSLFLPRKRCYEPRLVVYIYSD